jgi:hypothetical protein
VIAALRRWARHGNLIELQPSPRAPRSLTSQRVPGLDVDRGEVYTCRGCRVEYHDPLAGAWDGPALCRGCGWWLEVVNYDTRWHRRCAARSAV